MGNAQVPRVDEPRSLLSEYNDLAYQDVLGSYKLFKVTRCVHEREGLVLVKLFILRDGQPDLEVVKARILQVKDAFRSQWLYPNVVPYQACEIAGQSAILLRQHFARNLYERIHTRPFLSETLKCWLAFQVLCSVCQAHSAGAAHGDLKTENVFVSSWNHATLTDFAMFKPLLLPEDDPSEFSFFFESNLNRRRCYLAPERFDSPDPGRPTPSLSRFSSKLAAMDVFSLGCVLAELYLDGQTLMDLPELLQYRSRQLDLQAKISQVRSGAVQEILGSMLARDPAQRHTSIEYLRRFCEQAAPACFCNCLLPLSVLFLHPIYQQPDMRVALLRVNFAGILWSVVGPARLSRAVGVECPCSPSASGADVAAVWEAWQQRVQRVVRFIDDASLHGMVNSAVQAASQWGQEPHADVVVPAAPGGQRVASGGSGIADAQQHVETQALAPALAHPLLNEARCERFVNELFAQWEEGCQRCTSAGVVDDGEEKAGAIYESFLADLCAGGLGAAPGPPGPGARERPAAGRASSGSGAAAPWEAEEDEVQGALGIVCGFVCSAVQHVGNARLRCVCLDMMELLAPFASQAVVLEQIVPYCHALMSDPFAKVRASAIEALTRSLDRVEELPPRDSPLFMEYIFPQLVKLVRASDELTIVPCFALLPMSGMSGGEPVVLLAVAQNIGALVRHAIRLAESSVAAAQRGAAPGRPDGGPAAAEASAGRPPGAAAEEAVAGARPPVEVETFDVQCKHLREEAKKIVKALLEQSGGGHIVDGVGAAHEDPMLSLATSREVKVALLRNMCVLADCFGRDGTHNFLLQHAIAFMNDPALEVRAAFCEEAAFLPRRVGQVSAEGIIWPCYEQALQDQEERVLAAALAGLAALVQQEVLRRPSLVTVATKVAPLLVHPAVHVRARAAAVFEALGSRLSAVDQYVFVMPAVRPLLRVEVPSLRAAPGVLARPLGRRLYKQAILRRGAGEGLHDALLHKKPLPSVGLPQGYDEEEWGALELLRPYVHLLLRSRPGATGLGQGLAAKEDCFAFSVPLAAVQSVRYATVNPGCAPSRPLHGLAEAEIAGAAACAPALFPGRGPRHPLSLFSMHAFLARALQLPLRRRELGSLTNLNGAPYSIYSAGADAGAGDLPSRAASSGGLAAGTQPSPGQQELWEAPAEPDADAEPAALAQGAPLSASGALGAEALPLIGFDGCPGDGRRASVQRAPRRPSVLLATLYEYAHQSGVPVVKVDTTDDSRILVTGGKDGVVKLWNCAQLERDVAVSSSHTFTIPCGSAGRKQRLRALRTVRDAKAVAVGSESGDALLYKIEPSRAGPSATQVCRFEPGGRPGSCAVMCMEQFDNELESLVVFAQAHGAVQGWDIRSQSRSWSVSSVPPWLGIPSCLALGSDGHSICVGTLSGGLLVYDLRFLAPWKQWRVSSGAAILSMRSTTRQCLCSCCDCLRDTKAVENLRCGKGRLRLRCLIYYLMIRPPILIVVNIPLGYPLDFCPALGSTVRCFFAFLLAVLLRPAPQEALQEDAVSAETRCRFSIATAMRLCDFAQEAYKASICPATVTVRMPSCFWSCGRRRDTGAAVLCLRSQGVAAEFFGAPGPRWEGAVGVGAPRP
ncbi:unnamed protein product [Prorocentrum cordatum]|uniref:non-specific serine/threonine protein kinase n=1 Tax=Prorocentrum cordatum TaxID=2364126 RepID=A0ABN9PPS1_9DINO|nr:unnamed protein product [Polarella glacialis]